MKNAQPKVVSDTFIDIHSHIDQHSAKELPGIVERASQNRVGAIIAAGTTVESSERCIAITRQFGTVFAAAGIHPQDIREDTLGKDLRSIEAMLPDNQVVAVSEIGLDYQPNSPDKAIQRSAFAQQITFAQGAQLAVIFHNREATDDTLRILRETDAGKYGGAAHYFQGTWDYACALMDIGFHISLAKPLTRLPELQRVAKSLPIDRIVLETDSYPQTFKSNRNRWTEPKDVPIVASCLARLRDLTVEEVREATMQNTLTMLGKGGNPVAELCQT